jgi:hypothetical protein
MLVWAALALTACVRYQRYRKELLPEEHFYKLCRTPRDYGQQSTLKFKGAYVELYDSSRGSAWRELPSFQPEREVYRQVYKFQPNGKVMGMAIMGTYPTNDSLRLSRQRVRSQCYTLQKGNLRIEQIKTGFLFLDNFLRHGLVRGDTIFIYNTSNMGETKFGKHPLRLFVYDSTLTALPVSSWGK